MVDSVVHGPSKFRFATFAVVLLLVSGLVIALFDEARAASIEVESTGSLSGTATLFARVVIPSAQRLPIESVSAILESNSGGLSQKSQNQATTLVSQAICRDVESGCTSSELVERRGSAPAAFTAISLENIYVNDVGAGYVAGDGYFGACPCSISRLGGYGYDAIAGYGYAGAIGEGPYNENGGSGYGYSGEELILRFQVTVDTTALGSGNFFFTFVVDTGSTTIGQLSSAATNVLVSAGGGSGGGGGPTTGDGTTPGPITVNAVSITPPEGATAAFQATVTAVMGQTVTINIDSPFLGDITFVPGSDLSNAVVTVVHWPADNPPGDVGALPEGVTVAGFVSITVSSGGTTHTVTIAVTVPAEDAGDPTKAVLLKWEGDAWVPKSLIALTQNADGSWSGTGTSDCCSDYLVAFDEEEPTVEVSVPSGTLTGTQTFTATASDNVQVAKVEFFVGDQKVGEDTTAPYQSTVNTAMHGNGEKTVRALATDFVGNTAESSTTSSFDNEDGGTPPGGNGNGGSSWLVILIILIVIAIIGAAGYYFYQQQKK